jgi:hypothetical protein
MFAKQSPKQERTHPTIKKKRNKKNPQPRREQRDSDKTEK